MEQSFAAPPEGHSALFSKKILALVGGALGVVYGDIGTSPLYTVREAFNPHRGLALSESNILGVLSLIFWAIILVVTIKYVIVIMRVDNRGEGGVLALTVLAAKGTSGRAFRRIVAFTLGLFGISLFYGDGLITPAISVLSAVEGLSVATSIFDPYILPLAIAILVGLFSAQRHGTAKVGRFFGPIMSVWFIVLGILGLIQIVDNPLVLKALHPSYAFAMFKVHGFHAFAALGVIVLAVTGAEALYADLGHFGRNPIRLAWFGLVLPGLVLNYFGQGALLMGQPEAVENPFYLLAPPWALYPMVALATMATVIASQAVISGVFSLTRQAIQLGYLPRLTIRHTSAHTIGQIYLPSVNWLLLGGILALVLEFQSSSALAAAYGISVTGAMVIDALLALMVFHYFKRWSWLLAGLVFGLFLTVDLAFWGATSLRIPEGGWVPLLVATLVFILMMTWRQGRHLLSQRLYQGISLEKVLDHLSKAPLPRVPGTAIFMTARPQMAPRALLSNMEHNKIVHQRNILMSVITEEIPHVPDDHRVTVNQVAPDFYVVTTHYGFAEQPNIPRALRMCHALGLDVNLMESTFFLNRETLIPSAIRDMPLWQDWLFVGLSTMASDATEFFQIPHDRVIELGAQLEI